MYFGLREAGERIKFLRSEKSSISRKRKIFRNFEDQFTDFNRYHLKKLRSRPGFARPSPEDKGDFPCTSEVYFTYTMLVYF